MFTTLKAPERPGHKLIIPKVITGSWDDIFLPDVDTAKIRHTSVDATWTVDEEGRTVNIALPISSGNSEVDNAIINAVKNIHFQPGTYDGNPASYATSSSLQIWFLGKSIPSPKCASSSHCQNLRQLCPAGNAVLVAAPRQRPAVRAKANVPGERRRAAVRAELGLTRDRPARPADAAAGAGRACVDPDRRRVSRQAQNTAQQQDKRPVRRPRQTLPQ